MLKKEDLERLKIEVDDRILTLQTKVTKLTKKCESLDDKQTQNDMFVDCVKAESFNALEKTTIKLKDYIAKEVTAV